MLRFYVTPSDAATWTILFEGQAGRTVYGTFDAAMKAACKAAEAEYKKSNEPTGVRLRAVEGWQDAVEFGTGGSVAALRIDRPGNRPARAN